MTQEKNDMHLQKYTCLQDVLGMQARSRGEQKQERAAAAEQAKMW